ncbi:hypothetical protein SDC9_141830 [bioreactor metagenome]|uniref:Uncharacterized protein n=1 Tax=bioreactor metagenome TaxID=1076179 RepID=A0A645E273_9ZZZZ
MTSAKRGLVNGPLATITGVSGSTEASALRKLTNGCCFRIAVIFRAKTSRSTANALPEGKAHSSATRIIRLSNLRISAFNKPTPFVSALLRKELEQTSSAKSAV